ncbi:MULTISPECIES: FecR family protein [Sphingobacterium]|uniref:FecR family protein n=1 Tax=Sphingobacterium TaxID=28453 RepID=UPI0013DD1DA8|nr:MULTISPECIES: FecR domain-containing protein [unclassified Sphingobacterium]
MKREEIDLILDKYKEGTCTPEEIAFIESWYMAYRDGDLQESMSLAESTEDLDLVWADIQEKLFMEQSVRPNRQLLSWSRIAVAASVFVCVSIGLYFYLAVKKELSSSNVQEIVADDIAPVGNGALLTLADGTVINLNENQEGIIIGSDSIVYTDGTGVLAHSDAISSAQQKEQILTLSTPRGGQYQITLPDGTKVWLNAATTIKYPSRFTQQERRVELDGEAYFEVAKKEKQMFVVSSHEQEIKVLGTQFNVSAYREDQLVKTTLLEGSVRVRNNYTNQSIKLSPGQQSVILSNDSKIDLEIADVEEVTAWKNGYFKFNNESIESIMRKVARWYDIEIQYQDLIDAEQVFSGRVSKGETLSSVLESLELTGGVHFKIEGRRITVMR